MRLAALVTMAATAAALVPPNSPRRPVHKRRPLTPVNGFFDNAFKNESFDNKPKGGGAPAKKTVPVTIGSRTVQALPNQRLKDVVRAARAPIKFNCENGQCGTCENRVDGRLARICTMSVPARGCKITRK